jgi:biopolymer transport protein ExbD
VKDKFQKGQSDEASLTLTPLLDMFTIILIFLIVSFQAQDKGFEPDENVDLPESRARSVFKPAVNIAISESSVSIDDDPVVSLTDGTFKETFYEQEKIPDLVDELKRYYAAIKEDEGGPDIEVPETDEAILLVEADRDLDYRTLYLVLRSGALAGFTKYRLAIMKK